MTRQNVAQLDEFKALADRYNATLRITRLRPSGRGADVWDDLHPLPAQQRELKRHPQPLRPHRRQDVLSIRRQGREREALRLAALGEAALVPGAPDAPLPTERPACVRFQELSTLRTRSQVHASSMTQAAAADRWTCVGVSLKNR
jgi:hypothetical protein